MHLRTHLEGKTCSSSQTEKVVVLEDEMEIIDLISSYQRKKTADSTTQTEDIKTTDGCTQTRGNMPKVTSQDASMQTDPADLSIVAAKLDEILMLLRANMNNNSLNVSDVLKWVNTNTSTPLPGMQSVTIVPVEDVVMEVPGTSAAEPTSPIFHSEVLSRESDDHCSPPARKVLFATDVTEQQDQPQETEVDIENVVTGGRVPFSEVTHKYVNRKTSGSKEKVLTLECRTASTICEIKDRNDIIHGDFEFRVRRDILADLKDASCSDGNFMWLVTRRIFTDEELIGRNFFGRKGRPPLSPRRRNCLRAAFLECCGTSYAEFTKSVNSINNGIRSLRR